MTDLEISYSIRARILQKIGERVQQMIVLLPSGMDADAQLFWARRIEDPKEELPVVIVWPRLETSQRTSFGMDAITMAFDVHIVCLIGKHNFVDLGEDLIATMRRTIPGSDPTLDGLVTDIRYVSGGADEYPTVSDQALNVMTSWEIDYETQANNPDEQ